MEGVEDLDVSPAVGMSGKLAHHSELCSVGVTSVTVTAALDTTDSNLTSSDTTRVPRFALRADPYSRASFCVTGGSFSCPLFQVLSRVGLFQAF